MLRSLVLYGCLGFLPCGCGGEEDRPSNEGGPADASADDAAPDGGQDRDSGSGDDGGGGEDAGPSCRPTAVDVLFVVDTSPDMTRTRPSLLAGLAVSLEALTAGWGEHTLRVGVVSSDLGTGFEETCALGGDDGVLRSDPAPDAEGCDDEYPSFLADPVDPTDVVCIGALPAEGCVVQRPADAVFRALVEHDQGFLRPGSLLVVVIVESTEECSTDDEAVFDPAEEGPMGMRCYEAADRLVSPAALADRLTTVRRPSSLFLAAIGGVPEDLGGCDADAFDCIAALPELVPVDEGGGTARPVCDGELARARPAPRLVETARALETLAPGHVALASICDPDWAVALAAVGGELGGALCFDD